MAVKLSQGDVEDLQKLANASQVDSVLLGEKGPHLSLHGFDMSVQRLALGIPPDIVAQWQMTSNTTPTDVPGEQPRHFFFDVAASASETSEEAFEPSASAIRTSTSRVGDFLSRSS
jgi:hypothetical protein